MSVGEFKTHFSKVLEWIKKGQIIAVTYGKKKEIVGYLTPKNSISSEKRTLGMLEGNAKVIFHEDFKISEEEFLQQ